MRTAIQELIEKIDNGIHNKGMLVNTFRDTNNEIGNGIKYLEQVKIIAQELLLLERNQIIDAYTQALTDNNLTESSHYGVLYFNNTFKTKQP